jgi:D-galactarolactone cycloisomerase
VKIKRITAYAIKIPRDITAARGTAGSPARLINGKSTYRLAENYETIYSTMIETALIRVETDTGLQGWGEAQSPVAPEVVVTIIETILGPLLIGEDPLAHERLWSRMYSAMRVRGHTGSFLLDAMAGIDTALWDIKGKHLGAPVCELLGGPFTTVLPASPEM